MSGRRDKIPKFAFVEAQVIHRAVRANALERSVREVESDYGLRPGSLGHGVFLECRVVSLLYCLILVPKEVWARGSGHELYERISNQWTIDPGMISQHRPDFWESPTYHFIHHLRNALAHARFDFTNWRFDFWDQLPSEKSPSFRASLQLDDLQSFLEIVGALLANLGGDSELRH
jgi:hypothetical protein